MPLAGFSCTNHPQQEALDGVDDRALPRAEFWVLNRRFKFTIDVAASPENAKLNRFLTITQDGLSVPWAGESVYCNPPYSNIRPWVEKAWRETDAIVIVLLLPANRTEQSWWQSHIEPRRDQPASPLRVEFLPNRLRFLRPGRKHIGPNERPPFGSCLCIWDYGKGR